MTKGDIGASKKLLTRREFLVGGGAVLAVAALAACSNKIVSTSGTSSSAIPSTTSGSPSTPKYGGTLRIIMSSTISSPGWPSDPAHASGGQEFLETLLRQDGKGNTIPWLAESYNIADDLKSIAFTLKKNIKFHDGSDFNAEVAKWNLDNMINAGRVSFWASVDVIDDYTIRVNLTQWANSVLSDFGDAQAPAQMVSKAAFDKHGIDWMRQNPVGTGPFKCTAFQQDVSIKSERNPNYWITGKPYLDSIDYVIILDPTTQKMAMQTGEADRTNSADPGRVAKEYADMGLNVQVLMDSNNFLVPDSANPDSPWSNQKAREALEYAIDKEALTKAFGFGFLKAPYQIPPRDSASYNPDFTLGRKFDPAKARQLLGDAGYSGGINTSIIVAPSGISNNRDVVVSLQTYLADVGIKAELEFPDMSSFSTHMGPGTWSEGTILCVPVPRIDPYFSGGLSFMFNFVGKSWLNTPELREAYNAAFASRSQDVNLIRALTDKITQDCLFIPFYEAGLGIAQRPYVVCDFGERGGAVYYTPEDALINK